MLAIRILISCFLISFQAQAAEPGVEIDVTVKPVMSFKAKSSAVKGAAYKTPDGGIAAENVTVDMKTIKTEMSLRDKHLREYVMAEKYPYAKLVKAQGKDGKGTATLEIKGQNQDVAGTYDIKNKMVTAHFPVSLPAAGITNVRYKSAGVKDEVTVHITMPLLEAPPKGEMGKAEGESTTSDSGKKAMPSKKPIKKGK